MGNHGIRAGMSVRDAAGNKLGKVRRVYAWGFEVSRGLWSPYQWVFRHDEVSRVADDGLVVARSPDDLQQLASGGLPDTWRRYTPPFGGERIPAAPAEAAAAERVVASPSPEDVARPLEPEEERESVRTRGQPGADAAAHS